MLLRRITQHVKDQNWFAVGLDFVIVVLGVFIGIQLGNWNDARANKEGAVSAMERLRGEVSVNIAALEDRIERIDESGDVRLAAIKALQMCDASEATETAMSQAVGELTTDIIPSFINNTTKEIARQDSYLKLLSEEFRTALNIYDGSLIDESEQLKINFGLMWDHHIATHPFVGMEMQGDTVFDGSFTFDQPMDVLCQDTVFRRQFIMTEVWHQSTKLRLERFKESSERFLETLDQELEAQR